MISHRNSIRGVFSAFCKVFNMESLIGDSPAYQYAIGMIVEPLLLSHIVMLLNAYSTTVKRTAISVFAFIYLVGIVFSRYNKCYKGLETYIDKTIDEDYYIAIGKELDRHGFRNGKTR